MKAGMKIAYENKNVTLWHGDCREWSGKADAVVSDPPYGMDWDGDIRRGPNGTGKTGPTCSFGQRIANDKVEFDPYPWLGFERVVLWGWLHFAQRLPKGSALVWLKRYDQGFGSFLSDADIAWMKGGHGVYCRRDLSLQGESSSRMHPTQKPVGLMSWCMDRAKIAPDATVLDPFCGSGTTLIAALETGRKAIGIECDERWVDVAVKRMERWHAQGRLDFGTANTSICGDSPQDAMVNEN